VRQNFFYKFYSEPRTEKSENHWLRQILFFYINALLPTYLIQRLILAYTYENIGNRFPAGEKDFCLPRGVKTGPEPPSPHSISRGGNRSMREAYHLPPLVSRLWIHGAIPPLPYVFRARCLLTEGGQFHLYFIRIECLRFVLHCSIMTSSQLQGAADSRYAGQ
jgi:hypothetical protein